MGLRHDPPHHRTRAREARMNSVVLAASAAAVIAFASAIFGVGMARILWAEDLQHARHIDEIRSRTEAALHERIASQERIIEIQKKRLAAPDQR
jgi:hypothetical protein